MMKKQLFVSMMAITFALSPALVTAAEPTAGSFNQPHLAPVINLKNLKQVAPNVQVISDERVNYVPNVGIIEGKDSILIVDTGMGPANGQIVFNLAKKIAGKRTIYLTTTHFHPEHSFGASAFKNVTYIANRAQADELGSRGDQYISLFRSFGSIETESLKNAKIVIPNVTYKEEASIDLGGQVVRLYSKPAHTQGDQVVFVEGSNVVFLGDLVEDKFFPIMPDQYAKGSQWIEVMNQVLALNPKIAVPGHGAIQDASLIATVRDYLAIARDKVQAGIKQGLNQTQISEKVAPELAQLHPDWDNKVFIPFEVAAFYADLTHTPAVFPSLSKELSK